MTLEEAFERAKAAHGTGAYDDATLEFIFPGLLESEDERIRKELVAFFIEVRNREGNEGYWHDLKVANILAYLEKQKEQNPAEWGDEDKRMIGDLIRACHGWAMGTIEILPSVALEYEERLKSLRPSWKPSEEQMGALSWMLENARGNIDFDPLKELYEQLKKLM